MPRAASPTRIGAPRSISRLRRLCRSCRLPAVLPNSYCFWCWPCRCCPKPSPCSLLTMHPGAGRPAAANHLGGAPLSIDHLLLDVSLRPATAAVLPRPLLAASSRCWTCDCGWPPRRCFPPLTRCAGRPAAAGHRADAPSPLPYRLTCGSCWPPWPCSPPRLSVPGVLLLWAAASVLSPSSGLCFSRCIWWPPRRCPATSFLVTDVPLLLAAESRLPPSPAALWIAAQFHLSAKEVVPSQSLA